jgi:hypothetical protein
MVFGGGKWADVDFGAWSDYRDRRLYETILAEASRLGGSAMTEPEALATVHHWAESWRRRSRHVALFVRYLLGCLLLWISSGCISLARIVAPVPS